MYFCIHAAHVTVLLNLLTPRLNLSLGIAEQDFLLQLIPVEVPDAKLTNVFILSNYLL